MCSDILNLSTIGLIEKIEIASTLDVVLYELFHCSLMPNYVMFFFWSPTVCFDGLYFGLFVPRIVSTFNFSANFVFHFIFLSDTDVLRCHRHICVFLIL
jgi:hypothetical protein